MDEVFKLWTGADRPDYIKPPKLKNAEKITVSCLIDQREVYAAYGHNIFLHGVAVEFYHGAMVLQYAINPNAENVSGEMDVVCWSYDQGKTWENFHTFQPQTPGRSTSHGVFLVKEDILYALVPEPAFDQPKGKHSPAVLATWQYDEKNNEWKPYGTDAEFWPNCPAVYLDNGEIMLAGSGNTEMVAGTLTTTGGKLHNWSQTLMPGTEISWPEVGVMVTGSHVTALVRPQELLVDDEFGVAEKRGSILVCESDDYGKTFTQVRQSNIYTSKSKIAAGILSNGRPYAIFNMSIEYPANYKPSRMRYLIALGDPGQHTFNKLYTLLEAQNPVAYPFCVEKDGILYVVYSELLPMKDHKIDPDHMSNSNNAMLMCVPIECLS